VSPLKYRAVPRGTLAGKIKFHRTLYVPAGIARPDGTTTFNAAKPELGM
jgi:hypothetical protein